jgi:hypothetical protein
MLIRKFSTMLVSLACLAIPVSYVVTASAARQEETKTDAVLKAADVSPKIFPETVFYAGKVAPVQMRNTGGLHFADGPYVVAGLVDTAGYATGLKEKYQGYLLTEVSLEINGQPLKAGAYGIGFLADSKFIVSDVGGHNLLEIAGQRDTVLKRATPLQVVAAPEAGAYRLYLGRNFVTIKRAH